MTTTIDYAGTCYCGTVSFKASGPTLFNALCHCRVCSRGRGVGPVQLIGLPKECIVIVTGEDKLKDVPAPEELKSSFLNTICSNCGSTVYQSPKGAPFKAITPTTLKIETVDDSFPCGVSCKLPAELLPTAHINYENRLFDVNDDLIKFSSMPGGVQVKNDGTPV